jgi:hypothetical protein
VKALGLIPQLASALERQRLRACSTGRRVSGARTCHRGALWREIMFQGNEDLGIDRAFFPRRLCLERFPQLGRNPQREMFGGRSRLTHTGCSSRGVAREMIPHFALAMQSSWMISLKYSYDIVRSCRYAHSTRSTGRRARQLFWDLRAVGDETRLARTRPVTNVTPQGQSSAARAWHAHDAIHSSDNLCGCQELRPERRSFHQGVS